MLQTSAPVARGCPEHRHLCKCPGTSPKTADARAQVAGQHVKIVLKQAHLLPMTLQDCFLQVHMLQASVRGLATNILLQCQCICRKGLQATKRCLFGPGLLDESQCDVGVPPHNGSRRSNFPSDIVAEGLERKPKPKSAQLK